MTHFPLFNSPFLLGFDEFERTLDRVTKAASDGYPPYNIKKLDDKHYTIELAVAGFAKSDIDIELEGSTLTIKGSASEAEGNTIYQGIANRAFKREFKLSDTMVIKNAELINGMLKIVLDGAAAASKAVKIPISDSAEKKDTKEYLTEKKADK